MPEGGSGYLWLHESAGGVVQRYVRPRTARQEHQDKSGHVWKHAKLEERRSCCFVLPTKWLLPPNNRRLDSRRAESGGRLPTLSFVLVGSDVLRGSGRCPLPPLLTTKLETPELPDYNLQLYHNCAVPHARAAPRASAASSASSAETPFFFFGQ